MKKRDVGMDLLQRKSPFLGLSKKRLREIEKEISISTFEKGETLFSIGDLDGRSLFLLRGSVIMKSIDGRSTEVSCSQESAEFALANLKPRMYEVTVATKDVLVAWISTEKLEELSHHEQNPVTSFMVEEVYSFS